MKLTLKQFVDKVNELARQEVEIVNAGDLLFKATHYDLPERMLESYFKDGYTPKQTLKQINNDANAENAAEARMS